MILPGNLELEEVVDEHLLEKADESLQPRMMSPESQVEGTKEVLVKPESGREPMQKERHPIRKANSASLVCLRILKSNSHFIFSFLSAHADKIARPSQHTRVVESFLVSGTAQLQSMGFHRLECSVRESSRRPGRSIEGREVRTSKDRTYCPNNPS